jgi:CRP-like cAMP-binding protein
MNTEDKLSIEDLRGVDIFTGLSDCELEPIAKTCSQRTYQEGERCVVQGETIDELRIVNGGKVAIEMRIEIPPYTQTISITNLTKGKVFAWSALVEPHVPTASARCIQKVCIKASDLQRIFKGRPSVERVVMRNLVMVISCRLRDSRAQLVRFVAEMIKQGK